MDNVTDDCPETPNHIPSQNQSKEEWARLSVEFESAIFEDNPLGDKTDKDREPEDIDVMTI